AEAASASASHETFLYLPHWNELDPPEGHSAKLYDKRLVLLCERNRTTLEFLNLNLPQAQYLNLEAGAESIEHRFQLYAVQTLEAIRTLRAGSPESSVLIQLVICGHGEQQLFRGLRGVLNTASLENPKTSAQIIEVQPGETAERLPGILEEDACDPQAAHV